ncbi:MAG TPA: hypothetical protein VIK24_03190 [Pyrinomonadaceae bacterium]|jgi:hypothetical protein
MRSKNIRITTSLIALVVCFSIPTILQSSSAQKRSDDDRVRAFRRKHRQTGLESQITTTQAQQILQTKNYYASLNPRQTWVDGKGFLNFTSSDGTAEVSGQHGTAHFTNTLQAVEIGVRASTPAKNYLLDCTVKGPAPCGFCNFAIDGPDGHHEGWERTDSDWKHLLFTVSPDDTDWFVVKLTGAGMTFKSCDVMELP